MSVAARPRAPARVLAAEIAARYAYDPETGAVTIKATGAVVVRRHNCGYLWDRHSLCHRIAWVLQTGDWPKGMVDHINGDRTDNRWANLRLADHSLNASNQKRAMRTNKVGLLGVCFDPRGRAKPYRAGIQLQGQKRSLGVYATPQEAHAAYLKAKATLHPQCGPDLEPA